MFGDLMNKLKDAQQQMDDAKKRLSEIKVDSEVEYGYVKVSATGDKRITNISISDELIQKNDTELIEDLVLTAVNRALEKAEEIAKKKMADAAKDMLPNIPGL